jgi:glycosyltransferase involved in cell wall biosynthesis
MNSSALALVSVVTPMYNTVEYIEECIESVRRQTYPNWEYVIVNNCSDDGSAEIAHRYAALDARIRVVDNPTVLPAIANHNHALRQISRDAKYCKVVFSDDWLFPRCLEDMVALAETEPTVGVVGAFSLEGSGQGARLTELPCLSRRVAGHDMAKCLLLDERFGLWTPNGLLYRSHIVRNRDPFFNERNIHCDRENLVGLMNHHDFGFVPQVLTFTRKRSDSLTHFSMQFNTYVAGNLIDLMKFGRGVLSGKELEARKAALTGQYYNYLAICIIMGRRDREFWNYHSQMMREAGLTLSYSRVASALALRSLRAIANPLETLKKLKLSRTRDHYREA